MQIKQGAQSQSEARTAILFFRSAQKQKLGRGRGDLASCQVSLNSVERKSKKMSQPIRGQGGHFGFFFRSTQNTILVVDVKILLPVKFR